MSRTDQSCSSKTLLLFSFPAPAKGPASASWAINLPAYLPRAAIYELLQSFIHPYQFRNQSGRGPADIVLSYFYIERFLNALCQPHHHFEERLFDLPRVGRPQDR